MTATPWTPVDVSGAGLVFENVVATIDVIDNIAVASFSFEFPVTTDTNNAKVGGLTTAAATALYGKAAGLMQPVSVGGVSPAFVNTIPGQSNLAFGAAGAPLTNADLSGLTVHATITYPIS
jgi:hypothetical protein